MTEEEPTLQDYADQTYLYGRLDRVVDPQQKIPENAQHAMDLLSKGGIEGALRIEPWEVGAGDPEAAEKAGQEMITTFQGVYDLGYEFGQALQKANPNLESPQTKIAEDMHEEIRATYAMLPTNEWPKMLFLVAKYFDPSIDSTQATH